MFLRSIKVIDAPFDNERVRIMGELAYEDASVPPDTIWFDVPRHYAGFFDRVG